MKIKLLLIAVLTFILGLILYRGIDAKDPCRNDPTLSCWQKSVTDTFKRRGLSASLDLVDYYYQSQPGFAPNCHNFGHLLGTMTYDLFARGRDFSINPKTAFCSYGFYHGFMETLAAKEGDVVAAREFCHEVDDKLKSQTPDASLQCFHGIGHGWVNAHDRPDTWGNEAEMSKPALQLCRQVATNEGELSRCATGVFNGIAVFYQSGEYGLKPDANDPLKLCDLQIDPVFADACYLSLNITLMQVSEGDLVKAASYLQGISDSIMASHAMLNLAALNSFDEEAVLKCRQAQSNLIVACIQGYAFGKLEHGQPGLEYRGALEVCGRNELTEAERSGCYDYIYAYLPQWYSREKTQSICDSQEGDLKQLCTEKSLRY